MNVAKALNDLFFIVKVCLKNISLFYSVLFIIAGTDIRKWIIGEIHNLTH